MTLRALCVVKFNGAAHHLAKFSCGEDDGFEWDESFPTWLEGVDMMYGPANFFYCFCLLVNKSLSFKKKKSLS